MYKEDLALNNLQWLICHKINPNQTKMQYWDIAVSAFESHFHFRTNTLKKYMNLLFSLSYRLNSMALVLNNKERKMVY